MKTFLKIVIVLAVLGGAAYGGWWYWARSSAPAIAFRTVDVTRQDLLQSIAATGTAEPQATIDVGAQVSGLIDKFGPDPKQPTGFVDYNSHVKKGDLLAHIDESLFQADVDTGKAAMEQAKANVLAAEASLMQMKAKLVQAQHDWDRAQKLGPSDAMAQTDYDMYEANYETAKANVAAAEAAIAQNKAAVQGAEAALGKAKQNLDYCTIPAPVTGVIVARRVNVGQTVASALSAPSLFLLAEDLTHMQVWASVNEADIGQIHPEQPVTFLVDAFPNHEFKGKVGMIRLDATMTSNVVTYTVQIDTPNEDGKLLPYMTCNVLFEVARREHVLTVPNTALRYLPQAAAVAPEAQAEFDKISKERNAGAHTHLGGADKVLGSGGPGHPAVKPAKQKSTTQPHEKHGTVWVAENGLVKPIKVKIGITDGVDTEIISDELKEGQQVVVGEYTAQEIAEGTNPFAPQLNRRPNQR